MDENIRLGLQDQLVDLIMRVLVRHEELHYYQGYHDICVTFLLVVGEDVAFALVDKLSMNHLRDFMDADMDRTKHILNYMYPLIGRVNPNLRDFMER
ncbi:TBC1 domain family member 20-like [Mercenaria mercenaria]|uniref:TBC1 domain family member 20-like n=1 Tax=Mercenaria mercenaria TaxID=6596 RepID=UPI00234EB091|nr:TBC1 domain family member 20-like [Mercenaria mercenaria]